MHVVMLSIVFASNTMHMMCVVHVHLHACYWVRESVYEARLFAVYVMLIMTDEVTGWMHARMLECGEARECVRRGLEVCVEARVFVVSVCEGTKTEKCPGRECVRARERIDWERLHMHAEEEYVLVWPDDRQNEENDEKAACVMVCVREWI
jgi:hypothetical protein